MIKVAANILISTLALLAVNATSSMAETRIEDPNHVLDQVQKYLGEVPFENAFRIGQYANYHFNAGPVVCRPEKCDVLRTESFNLIWQVSQVTSDFVEFLSPSGPSRLTRSEYTRVHGNFLVNHIQTLVDDVNPIDVRNYATLRSAEASQLVWNDGRTIDTLIVQGDLTVYPVEPYASREVPFTVEMTNDLSALAQVVSVKVMGSERKTLTAAGKSRN